MEKNKERSSWISILTELYRLANEINSFSILSAFYSASVEKDNIEKELLIYSPCLALYSMLIYIRLKMKVVRLARLNATSLEFVWISREITNKQKSGQVKSPFKELFGIMWNCVESLLSMKLWKDSELY